MSSEAQPQIGEGQTGEAPQAQKPTTQNYSGIAKALQDLKSVDATAIAQKKAFEDARAQASKFQTLQKLASNPETQSQVLQAFGIDPEKLKPSQPDPTSSLKSELESVKQELEALRGYSKQTAREKALQETKSAVYSYVEGNEEFPAINGYGQEAKDLVFQTMVSQLESTGELKSEEDAAREVEQTLRETYERLHGVFGSGSTPKPRPTLTNQTAGTSSPHMSIAELEASGEHEKAQRLFHERLFASLSQE